MITSLLFTSTRIAESIGVLGTVTKTIGTTLKSYEIGCLGFRNHLRRVSFHDYRRNGRSANAIVSFVSSVRIFHDSPISRTAR